MDVGHDAVVTAALYWVSFGFGPRVEPGAHKAKTAKIIESALGRFGIEPDRFVAADKPAQKGQAVVEVLAAR